MVHRYDTRGRPRRADSRHRAARDGHRHPRRLPAAGRAPGAACRTCGSSRRRARGTTASTSRPRASSASRSPTRPRLRRNAWPTPRGRCCSRRAPHGDVRSAGCAPEHGCPTRPSSPTRCGASASASSGSAPSARRSRAAPKASRWTSRTTRAIAADDVTYRYYDDPVALARDVKILVVAVPGGARHAALVEPRRHRRARPLGLSRQCVARIGRRRGLSRRRIDAGSAGRRGARRVRGRAACAAGAASRSTTWC